MLNMDKNDFLKSDFGKTLKFKIKLWDELLDETKNPLLDEKHKKMFIADCEAYWEAAKDALNYFLGKEYKFCRTDTKCGIVRDMKNGTWLPGNGEWLFRVR